MTVSGAFRNFNSKPPTDASRKVTFDFSMAGQRFANAVGWIYVEGMVSAFQNDASPEFNVPN